MSDKLHGETADWRSWLLSQDFLAGVVLLGVGGFALYQSADLTAGSLSQFGPGLLPRVLASGVVLSGMVIIALGTLAPYERVSDFRVRGPVFVSAALVAFALAITPLGLIVAAPLTILIASLADSGTRWREAGMLALVFTAASLVLFGYLLKLSIPLYPAPEILSKSLALLK